MPEPLTPLGKKILFRQAPTLQTSTVATIFGATKYNQICIAIAANWISKASSWSTGLKANEVFWESSGKQGVGELGPFLF